MCGQQFQNSSLQKTDPILLLHQSCTLILPKFKLCLKSSSLSLFWRTMQLPFLEIEDSPMKVREFMKIKLIPGQLSRYHQRFQKCLAKDEGQRAGGHGGHIRLYNWHACPSEVQYLIVLQLRKTISDPDLQARWFSLQASSSSSSAQSHQSSSS